MSEYTRTYGAPDIERLIPVFHIESVPDPLASEREGRPIFRDEERVEIIIPGVPQTRPVERVNEDHKRRWPEQYKKFKDGLEFSAEGTPLEQWPILKRSQVLEFKAIGFLTVESIANASDPAIQKVMGSYKWRDLARAYLDEAAAQAIIAQKIAEDERQKQIISEQNAKIENLSSMLERVTQELLALKNAPHPVASYIPGQHDPVEAMRQMAHSVNTGPSSLDDVPMLPLKKRKA